MPSLFAEAVNDRLACGGKLVLLSSLEGNPG